MSEMSVTIIILTTYKFPDIALIGGSWSDNSLLVAFAFLPQNFGKVVGPTNDYFVSLSAV